MLVLTGARQTGKTTLLTHLFPRHHLVTLDLPQDAALGESARRLALVSPGPRPFPLGEGVEVVSGWSLPAWLGRGPA